MLMEPTLHEKLHYGELVQETVCNILQHLKSEEAESELNPDQ